MCGQSDRKDKVGTPQYAPVFKNLRQMSKLAEDSRVLDLETNVLIWGLFMSTPVKASVHLGPHYNENLEVRALSRWVLGGNSLIHPTRKLSRKPDPG